MTGKKDKSPSTGGAQKKPADLDKLIAKYKNRIAALKKQGASDDKLSALHDRLAVLVEKKARREKKQASVDHLDLWKSQRLDNQVAEVVRYCKHMGYTTAEELLYAVTVSDTPVDVELATKHLMKAHGIDALNSTIRGDNR